MHIGFNAVFLHPLLDDSITLLRAGFHRLAMNFRVTGRHVGRIC